MFVFGNDEPRIDAVAEDDLRFAGHGGAGLAGPYNIYLIYIGLFKKLIAQPQLLVLPAHMPGQQILRLYCPHPCSKNFKRIVTHVYGNF